MKTAKTKFIYFFIVLMLLLIPKSGLTANVPKTIIHSNYSNYMLGGYSGYPLVLLNPHLNNSNAFYMNFSAKQMLEHPQRQYFAYCNTNYENFIPGVLSSLLNVDESMGSLALDPATNNLIFVWQAKSDSSSQSVTNTYFAWDLFSECFQPGANFTNHTILRDNENSNSENNQEFIYPIIHISPSPYQGYRRVFVLHHIRVDDDDFTKDYSSGLLLSIADINAATYYEDSSELIWVERKISYTDIIQQESPGERIRAYPSFAVSKNSGTIAVVLYLIRDIPNEPESAKHNFVVLLHRNYGEGNQEEPVDFEVYNFLIENRKEPDWFPSFDPDEVANITDANTLAHIDYYNEKVFKNTSNWAMVSQRISNTTITFDDYGNLHFAGIFVAQYEDNETGEIKYLENNHTINSFVFNTYNNTLSVYPIYPSPYGIYRDDKYIFNVNPDVETKITIPFSWDFNDTGYVNIKTDYDNNFIPYPASYPYFHHDWGIRDKINQIRMTQFSNEIMGIMWMDSARAKIHHESKAPEKSYPEYFERPDIMVSFFLQFGIEWTEPIRINSLVYPELGNIPAYIYPADRILKDDDYNFRLYYLYVDKYQWEPFNDIGDYPFYSTIKLSHIEFTFHPRLHYFYPNVESYTVVIPPTSEEITNEKDIYTERPQITLYQNYPNPFNPSTTIDFYVDSSLNTTHVNLSIYNIRGQLINTLINQNMINGKHSVVWEGFDSNNKPVSSGVYLYRLYVNGNIETRRMVLMK